MTTIYVVKGCLISGVVLKVDAKKSIHDNHFLYFYKDMKRFYVGAGDYYLDEQEALERARTMRDRKLESLKKQIAKLEGCTFGEAK